MRQNYEQINDDWQLAQALHKDEKVLRHMAFKDVNLTAETELALSHRYEDCIFLGCTLPSGFRTRTKNSINFPQMDEVMFDPFRSRLYTGESLYEGYRLGHPESYQQCYDGIVYRHYLQEGKQATNVMVTLARSLHDYSISNNLHRLIDVFPQRNFIGVMGGHNMLRTEPQYEEVVRICKRLTELGSIMISGGGPGAMEATHLGAWMAGRTEEELQDAIQLLRTAPSFTDELWLDTAVQVCHRYPQKDYLSIGLPTWLYGHEPSTPFATAIAKYFDNSIREDSILTLAYGGIIFTPGSAGTLQEIFQEAVQDHYLSFGYASPMCFLGEQFWTKDVPVYPFIQDMIARGRYKNLIISLHNDAEQIVEELLQFRNANTSEQK